MSDSILQVPIRLNEQTALQLAADIALIPTDSNALLDFSATQHFEPFAMLLVGSAVRRAQRLFRATGRQFSIPTSSIDSEGFAGHMGFWQSMDLDIGRSVSAESGKASNVPITRIDIGEMYRDAGGTDPRGSGVLEARAAALARILSNPYSPVLHEALTYALRELFRNVLEHAMTPEIWVCGMSWPKRDYVQVAILDEGRGVRSSLRDNAEFVFATDQEAIAKALEPGVTRNKGKSQTMAAVERWADEGHELPLSFFENAGYGLYMLSRLCREAGQFLIASTSSYLGYISSASVVGSTFHQGTALRLVLQPSKVSSAFETLFEDIQAGSAGRRPMLSASTLRRLGMDSLAGGDGPEGG